MPVAAEPVSGPTRFQPPGAQSRPHRFARTQPINGWGASEGSVCYSAEGAVGRLVGAHSASGRISKAFATAAGRVMGSSNLGGLVGRPGVTGSADNRFYAITDAGGQAING
ncbi:hypothetical protein DFR29_12453 [Tahibacter aquaticus]|uniref:Uncharacterized protein n=1 Tax=Tahibacter aquaticus TaxID=520092 RepID=A0A4R6YKT9_9GAMM|nr:hypothetical protein [Tahibacter aquaticus]TDR37756.1 hypothetical protein DFR29_12453 [Tahibacter aquaticus]